MTLNIEAENGIRACLADCIISGTVYIEIQLLTEVIDGAITIGYASMKDPKQSWGLRVSSSLNSSVFMTGEDVMDYVCDTEDTKLEPGTLLGMLIEQRSDSADLSFYVNKQFIGSPFFNLPLTGGCPHVLLKFYQSSVRLLKNVPLPDN